MSRLLRLSLSVKISMVFSLVMAVTFSILILNNYFVERGLLNTESMARFHAIARNLADNAEYGVLIENKEILDPLIRSVRQMGDVNSVTVYDRNSHVLAKAGRSASPSESITETILTRTMPGGATGESFLAGMDGGPEQREDAAIGKEGIGRVEIEFNWTPIHRKLGRMRRQALLLAVISVFLGIFITYLIARLMVSPLKDLAHATHRVAEGHLDFQVESRTRDEIGELAEAFNIMTVNLKRSTVSRDYLDTILDSMADGIVVVNPDGAISMVNQGALTLSGFTETDLLDHTVTDLLSVEENTMMTHSGDKIPVAISEGTFRTADGTLKGTVYVVHDMRPMKKLQNRLLQSEKMAAVGQLAAGVSHEINNPLGVILGFAQGLVRRLPPGDGMELPLKSIEREAMRCKDLVQDLLMFSRATHAEKEPMDLNRAVEGALSLVQAQARMDMAEVKVSLARDLPKVYGNKNQIQQVVINLANNAMDAMPKGGTLSVETEMLVDDMRSWVVLKMQDTGVGIPPEVLPRIFEPFFTTKAVGKGTGLGLSLVYEIIKKHSGSVEVQSRPGRTEFTIKLPVRTGKELEMKMARQLARRGDGAPAEGDDHEA
jgi:C4-dicarboxylate-specific signal transduction histidine kinase